MSENLRVPPSAGFGKNVPPTRVCATMAVAPANNMAAAIPAFRDRFESRFDFTGSPQFLKNALAELE
jgi:hypothetical protein